MQTRFPPEPNGYLHVGHAKAICVDYGVADDFGGICNLRYDDTNPDTEDIEFAGSIIDDLTWLGFPPGNPLYASDYFEQLYQWAEHLVSQGLAYVDDQDGETISAQRGGYGKPGVESPHRDRPIEENLDLLRRMRAGEFADGSHVLRAKIDMQHENMQLRDPVMYRIRRGHHWRTGDEWVIYPTYDWAHGQSDAIEGVTHSLCTLEFDSHRALYDWYLDHLPLPSDKPRQTEFARLELTHTITSKRRLARLVADGVVDGWDDPRMPTLRGLRRRGYPPEAIRAFCNFIGVARTNSRHSIELLESFIRRQLNETSLRRMAVLRPLKLVITNWPDDADGNPCRRVPRGRQQPGEPRRRRPSGAVLEGRCTSSRTTSWRMLRRSTSASRRAARSGLRSAYLVTCTGCREGQRRQRRRGAVHLRPGDLGRQRPRRSQGEVDHALGLGRSCRRRHGRAVRPAVLGRGSWRGDGRAVRRSQPRFARTADRRQGRAGAGRHAVGLSGAVRATRLLRPRSEDAAAVPSHGRSARRVGEHPEAQLISSAEQPAVGDRTDRDGESGELQR